jgi:hypothetical protein
MDTSNTDNIYQLYRSFAMYSGEVTDDEDDYDEDEMNIEILI